MMEDAKISGITISSGPSILSCLTSTSYRTPSLRFLETAEGGCQFVGQLACCIKNPYPILSYHILFYPSTSTARSAHGAKSSERASERTNGDDTPIKYPTCHFSFLFFISLNPFLAAWRFYGFYGRKGYLDSLVCQQWYLFTWGWNATA